MKISVLLLIFILFIIFPNSSYCQYHWERLPGLNGGNIREISVDFAGNLIARTNYQIYKSTDKGSTWNPVYQDNRNSVNDIFFLNDSLGFACGAGASGKQIKEDRVNPGN